MTKRLLTPLMLIAATLMASAETIGPDEALARYMSGEVRSRGAETSPLKLAHTTLTTDGEAALYVFNRENADGGFMILSADDMALPVLAVADEGEFDMNNLPRLRPVS